MKIIYLLDTINYLVELSHSNPKALQHLESIADKGAKQQETPSGVLYVAYEESKNK